MSNYDFSRQLDLHKLNYKLNDPNTPEHDRKKIQEAIYGIKHQSQFRSVAKIREKMTEAMRSGDPNEAEKLKREAQRMDRDFKA